MPKRLLKLNGRLVTGALIGAVVSFVMALIFFVAVSSRQISENSEQIAANDRTREALCVLRAQIENRLAADRQHLKTSRAYLRVYPHGAPGIPVGVIRQSIAVNERELRQTRANYKALSILDCKEAP